MFQYSLAESDGFRFRFLENGSGGSGSVSGLQKRGQRKGATSKNIKNRQKVSKIFSTLFDIFHAGQKKSKIVKKCQKYFLTCFDNFRAAPVFRPLLGASEKRFRRFRFRVWFLGKRFQRFRFPVPVRFLGISGK